MARLAAIFFTLAMAVAVATPSSAEAAKPAELRIVESERGGINAIGPYVTVTVRNVGDRRAARATVRFFVSQDAQLSRDDRRLALTLDLPRIAGHRQAGRITSWDYDGMPGTFFACVEARGQSRSCRRI